MGNADGNDKIASGDGGRVLHAWVGDYDAYYPVFGVRS